MASRSEELQQFKRINLVEYAVSRGFQVDRAASSRSSVVVRSAQGDKLIIGKAPDGSYYYFNAKGSDSGTIIDLVQMLDGGTLGSVRKSLRGYQPSGYSSQPSHPFSGSLSPRQVDLTKVRATWAESAPLGARNSFLSDGRKLPAAVYLDPVFADRLRLDRRGNVLAAHSNEQGLCGFEIKNGTTDRTTFTGFSPGGIKGLASSRVRIGDRVMVVCETFIDMLSVAAICGTGGRQFVSLGGRPSPAQLQLLRSAIEKMPPDSTVELRLDNDQGGREMADQVIAELTRERDITQPIRYLPPPVPGTDWNDYLKQQTLPPPTPPASGP